MIEIPIASSFVLGGVLTLLVPAIVLILVAAWCLRVIRAATAGSLPRAQPPGTPPPVSDVTAPKV